MTLHDINMTRFREYWRRCLRTGHAYAEVAHRHPRFYSWRRTVRRNLLHALVLFVAMALSIAFFSPWPLAVWLGMLYVLILRNTWRYRSRVGSMCGAFVYSLHHYIAKVPILAGQCDYWMRRLLARKPRSLIEYRSS